MMYFCYRAVEADKSNNFPNSIIDQLEKGPNQPIISCNHKFVRPVFI